MNFFFDKLKTRCLPYLLCFSLVFGFFAFRPPEADAAVVVPSDGALAALLLAVAISAGIEFGSDQMSSSGLTAYIGEQLETYAAKVGATVADWVDDLGEISRRDDGTVLLTPPAYTAIQDFWSSWREDNEIVSGTSGQRVADAFYVQLQNGLVFNVGQFYRSGAITAVTSWSVLPEVYPLGYISRSFNSYANSFEIVYQSVRHGYAFWDNNRLIVYGSGGSWAYDDYESNDYGIAFAYNTYDSTLKAGVLDLNSKEFDFTFALNISSLAAQYARQYLTASQPASYEVLDLQENQSIALDVGAIAAPDATLGEILEEFLAKIADNTATATQTVVVTGTGEGEGEGEGEDEENPYLPYIPQIAQKIDGLSSAVDNIIDAVTAIPAAIAAAASGFINSIGDFLSGAHFGFTNIWHYVVSWVSSMAAGAAAIWSIWNGLPSAMVIPVYATAVVVIVIGLWRRFFG